MLSAIILFILNDLKLNASSSSPFYEEGDWLAKGAMEPSSGGAGFYFDVFVVPKCLDSFVPYLTLM